MRLNRNEYGYSLIETLVAVGMVAGLTVLATSMNSFSIRGERTNYRRACESIANSMITVIQERGPLEGIDQFVPINANRVMNAYTSGTPRGTNAAADFFTSANTNTFYNILSNPSPINGNSPFLNNYQGIRGSVRTLTAIFNNTAGVRCNWANFAPVNVDLTKINLPVSLNNLAPTVQVRLDPYNIATGAVLGCANTNPLHIAPPSGNAGGIGDGYTNDSVAAHPADFPGSPALPAGLAPVRRSTAGGITVRSDRGIQLRTRVQFTIQNEVIACEAAQRFQYSADRSAPAAPTISIAANNSTLLPTAPTAADKCQLGVPRTVVINVGYAGAPEGGTQLVCRDLSASRGYTRPLNPTYTDAVKPVHSIPCVLNAGSIDTSTLDRNLVRGLDDANFPANIFTSRGQSLAGAAREIWRPCDAVSICGVAPNAVAYGAPGVGYTLTYQLPQGCLINLEAVGIDTAGNLSAAVGIANSAVNMVPPNGGLVNAASLMSEVYKPVCGWDTASGFYKTKYGIYCRPAPQAQDDNFAGYALLQYETFNWRPTPATPVNTVGGTNWATRFANGYYTCRGSPGFGVTGGASPNGCCTGAGCTPFN